MLPETIKLVQGNVVSATIDQAPEKQSYEAVRLLLDVLKGKPGQGCRYRCSSLYAKEYRRLHRYFERWLAFKNHASSGTTSSLRAKTFLEKSPIKEVSIHPIIFARGISKRFGNTLALEGVDLILHQVRFTRSWAKMAQVKVP